MSSDPTGAPNVRKPVRSNHWDGYKKGELKFLLGNTILVSVTTKSKPERETRHTCEMTANMPIDYDEVMRTLKD